MLLPQGIRPVKFAENRKKKTYCECKVLLLKRRQLTCITQNHATTYKRRRKKMKTTTNYKTEKKKQLTTQSGSTKNFFKLNTKS